MESKRKPMKIWIDFANSPHVLFFAPIIEELRRRGHGLVFTARDFAQTLDLVELYGFEADAVGRHWGQGVIAKLRNTFGRALELRSWAKGRGIDLVITHNTYSQIIAARMLGIRTVTIYDYEYQPANHISFRLAHRIIVPFTFEDSDLRHYGARLRKVYRYNGIKENVYLYGFKPRDDFEEEFVRLFAQRGGYDSEKHLLFVVRPPATMSAYHNFENPLFEPLLHHLKGRPEVRTILIPRTKEMSDDYGSEESDTLVILDKPLEGKNLIWHADAVISAGGTMCREAAILGTPSYTIFWAKMGSVDQYLIKTKALIQLRTPDDFATLPMERKSTRNNLESKALDEVIELCLSTVGDG